MYEKNYKFEYQSLFQNLETLIKEAELKQPEAIVRLLVIEKLANPIYDFSSLDYQRILRKRLPPQVIKGIIIFEKMRQLSFLVQPIGKGKGTACAVRRVDYENLNWEELLELRGAFNAGFITKAIEQRAKPNFRGLDMLDEDKQQLYERIKVYFGNKKKPTLQSLAMNILSEDTDGKDFSERSLYIYLKATKEHQKQRQKAAGFNLESYYFSSISRFNTDEETVRQSIEKWDELVANIGNIQKTAAANLMKTMLPINNMNLLFQSQASQIAEMVRSFTPNFSRFASLLQKDDST